MLQESFAILIPLLNRRYRKGRNCYPHLTDAERMFKKSRKTL